MIVVTTEQIQGKEIKQVILTATVQFVKNIKTMEMKFTQIMEEAELLSDAGANAIVGMRFMTSSIIQGASEKLMERLKNNLVIY